MHCPKLKELPQQRQTIDYFQGYNHNQRIGSGEFYDMGNMTSDCFPLLAPRGKRGVYAAPEAVRGLIAKDRVCYADGSGIVIGSDRVDMGLTDTPKQLVSMGAYIIILPDRKYINTADPQDRGDIDAQAVTGGNVTFSLTRLDGEALTPDHTGADAPEEAEGTLWLDTSETPHVLRQWSDSFGTWAAVTATYVRITAPGIGRDFVLYDGVTLSGLSGTLHGSDGATLADTRQLAALEGAAVIWDRGEDYISVAGILDSSVTISDPVTVSRKMPIMDFVVESKNRLWGCRYGPDDSGEIVNRLYASKLGDFRNWSCFMGLSTDSYYVNLGSDGAFTGASGAMGFPLFFKEGYLHRIYGDYPSEFATQDAACRGVQAGCERSLAMVNETLYYKARHGVCAYDGSAPVEVSAALGENRYDSAVAGAIGNKYYISMRDTAEDWHLFVWDAARQLWHREDGFHAADFCACRGELYAVDADSGRIVAMLGSGEMEPGYVNWFVQTGILGTDMPDRKYISRLTVRMSMAVGGRARLFLRYDSMGGWEHVGTVNVTSLKSFSLPIRPRRCDHLQLRIEGSGEARIYSITKTIEEGSESP